MLLVKIPLYLMVKKYLIEIFRDLFKTYTIFPYKFIAIHFYATVNKKEFKYKLNIHVLFIASLLIDF